MNASTTVEIGLLIAFGGMLTTIAIYILNKLTSQAYTQGKNENRILSLERDVNELKGSHQSVWKYLFKSPEFRRSLDND